METITSSSARELLKYDEITMQQNLLFSDSLQDLKNLRTQLYSAAEYFEYSYTNDDHKQTVVETLKDYAIKALVNTVDHLGSATYKVNDLVDEKADEVSDTELRVSCVEQRLRTCSQYIDHGGLSKQSIMMNTPKYHKRYIVPVGRTMMGADLTKANIQVSNLDEEDDLLSSVRQEYAPSASPPLPTSPTFRSSPQETMPEKELEKHTVRPCQFPVVRSGSVSSMETTLNPSISITPRTSFERRTYPEELRKSASVFVQDGEKPKEAQQNTSKSKSKSKRLFKALLSRRKSKNDDMLYTYLDEY